MGADSDGNHQRWRGRRGGTQERTAGDTQEDYDRMEGCSYQIARTSTIREEGECWCMSTSIPTNTQQPLESTTNALHTSVRSRSTLEIPSQLCSSPRNVRKRRRTRSPITAAAAVSSAAALLISTTTASPVDATTRYSSNDIKGKGREVISTYMRVDDDDDTPFPFIPSSNLEITLLDDDAYHYQRLNAAPVQQRNENGQIDRSRISPSSDPSPHRYTREANGGGTSKDTVISLLQQQQQEQFTSRNQRRDVPPHYVFVDGEWVRSGNWSLYGQDGDGDGDADDYDNAKSSTTTSLPDAPSDTDDVDQSEGNEVVGIEHQVDDGDGTSRLTSIGWARTTNAVLGVDVNTELDGSAVPTSTVSTKYTSITSSPTSFVSSTTSVPTTTGLSTRTNMSTFPQSTASSSASGGASPSHTSTATSKGAFDFSRDVPNGWVRSGRTKAYAVPVIIGLSVFLACIILSLILLMVKSKQRKRRRRKYGIKLVEEGRGDNSSNNGSNNGSLLTALGRRSLTSDRRSRSPNADGDSRGISSAVEKEMLEKAANGNKPLRKRIKSRISRKWTPSQSMALTASNDTANGGGASNSRRGRNNIRALFNRRGEPVIEVILGGEHNGEVVEVDARSVSGSSSRSRGSDSPSASDRSGGEDASIASRSSSPSPAETSSNADPSNSTEGPASPHRPSLRITSPAEVLYRTNHPLSPTSAVQEDNDNEPTPYAAAIARSPTTAVSPPGIVINEPSSPPPPPPLGNSSRMSTNEIFSVPLPAVGPPAYMNRPSPAYAHVSQQSIDTPYVVDEKRALLASQPTTPGLPIAGPSRDPYHEQRRFEHLYTSRDGAEAEAEQRTGAPSASLTNGVSEEEGSSAVRRASSSDEPRLAAHIAIDDKALLNRIREAASAPSDIAIIDDLNAASAPTLDDAAEQDDETFGALPGPSQIQNSTVASAPQAFSILPRPPKVVTSQFNGLASVSKPIDEKQRLRMMEEQQAAALVPPEDMFQYIPSAPEITDAGSSLDGASAPSAPALDFETGVENEDEEDFDVTPSAPTFDDLEDVHQDEDFNQSVDQDSRPYREGIV